SSERSAAASVPRSAVRTPSVRTSGRRCAAPRRTVSLPDDAPGRKGKAGMVIQNSEQQKLLCPYCWEAFERNEIAGTDGAAPLRPNGQSATAEAGLKAMIRGWFGRQRAAPLPPPPSPHEIEQPRVLRCPKCAAELPPAFLESRALFIGLVGGSSTGKTTY